MSPRSKIIIDTDAGHDDALALMLLIKSGVFDISAITTVCGNSTINSVTRNSQAVLDLLKVNNVSLYSGAEKPLKRELVTAVVHGDSGLDGLDMSETTFELTDNAVEKILQIVDDNPGQVTILAIGPLTNIAECIQQDSGFASKLKELVIMGGAINVPGNKNRVAEFNFFVDPEAAVIVFKSGADIVLVPLDPCNEIVLGLDTFEALSGTALYEPLKSMMKHFIAGIESDEGVKGALVYDAMAAYYLLNPDAFEIEPMDIVIETKGEHTFGMSVAEKRLSKEKHINAKVVKHIDKEKFVADLLNNLRK